MPVTWEVTPLVAVTSKAYVPVEGELSAVSVSVEDTVPPAGIVTGLGRLTETPYGGGLVHAADKLTIEVNPFTDVRRIVVALVRPGVKVKPAAEG